MVQHMRQNYCISLRLAYHGYCGYPQFMSRKVKDKSKITSTWLTNFVNRTKVYHKSEMLWNNSMPNTAYGNEICSFIIPSVKN